MLLALALFLGLVSTSHAFVFVLDKATGSSPHCIIEELAENTPIQADLSAKVSQGATLTLIVYSGNQHLLEHQVTAKAAPLTFETGPQGGEIKFCFALSTASWTTPVATIKFDLRTGPEAVEYAHHAQLERMKPMEAALRMAEDDMSAIHHELLYLKSRERELRTVYENFGHKVIAYEVLLGIFVVILAVLTTMRSSKVIRKLMLG